MRLDALKIISDFQLVRQNVYVPVKPFSAGLVCQASIASGRDFLGFFLPEIGVTGNTLPSLSLTRQTRIAKYRISESLMLPVTCTIPETEMNQPLFTLPYAKIKNVRPFNECVSIHPSHYFSPRFSRL